MVNYFRSTLANITYQQPDDYIDPDYTAQSHIPVYANIYNILYPLQGRTIVLEHTNQYTQLIYSFGLGSVFTLYNPTITYTFADLANFKNSQVASIDLVGVANNLIGSSAVEAFLPIVPSSNQYYLDVYFHAKPLLQRLAAFVAVYAGNLSEG